MKRIDKRQCRKYADPGWKIPSGHGLLHAESVKYIIRTAVRNIGHKRLLVLYLYPRTRAAAGDFRPLWTVFQGKDDFITLETQEDGKTRWRTAGIERLGEDYYFAEKCAFYSQKDNDRIGAFFHDSKRGLKSVQAIQWKLQEQRRKKRQHQKGKAIMARMKLVPALPRQMTEWARLNVMPAYFFYDHKERNKPTKGWCSSCRREIFLEDVKYNKKVRCPHCKREITMKSRGRRGCIYDRGTAQIVQKAGDGLVVRIIKFYNWYHEGTDLPSENAYENARVFIHMAENGKCMVENYYYSYSSDELTSWRSGERPVFCRWQYNFEAETCGHLYCRNLQKTLKDTPWNYCPAEEFYKHFREPMDIVPFFTAYLEHPRLEHLVKVGFYSLAADVAYRGDYGHVLDQSQNRTHRILKVAPEDISYLRQMDVSMTVLRKFQEYYKKHLKDRQRLLSWQLEHKVERDVLNVADYVTPHKMMRYLDSQYVFLQLRKTQYGSLRYSTMQSLVSEYRDYLEMCVKQKYDMKNSFVLFPKDLQKSHDKVAHRIKVNTNAKMKRDFKAAYKRIMRQLDFEMEGMKIVYPATPKDIEAEGNALHHCVGGYVDRVAKQECIILFLRKCDDLEKSFYTIEVRNRKVIQVRGMKNESATPEVEKFMDRWEKRVLQGLPLQEAA